MSWRDHTWEFVVGTVSWIVAIGALALVLAIVVHDGVKQRRKARRR